MFCAVMAILTQNIPCTKTVQRLRKQFRITEGVSN
jgi:hypothetical protein